MSAKKRPGPVPKTLCLILGEEKGPDGKTYAILEPITDPDAEQAARARYEAVMLRRFRDDRREQP